MADKGTWKIKIGNDDFADYSDIIKGDPVGGGPNIIDPGGYGAADVGFLNLARRKFARRMVMTRQHASNAESFDWYMMAAQEWAGVADVIITHIDYSGGETNYKISGASVELEVDEPIGPTTITRLTVTGGAAVKLP